MDPNYTESRVQHDNMMRDGQLSFSEDAVC